eukprot:4768163-Pyramimonas_sp.AAC.1
MAPGPLPCRANPPWLPSTRPRPPGSRALVRPGRSTIDHLFAFSLIRERAREWNQPLWIAALDFQKAFDCIEHNSIWAAMCA